MLVDSHSHFCDIADPLPAIQRAKDSSVQWIVSNGVDLESNQKNQKSCQSQSGIWPCFGLHPKESLEQTTSKNQRTMDWIRTQLETKTACSLGETGLDFLLAKTDLERSIQSQWFEQQLDLASEFKKCVTIHARNAIAPSLKMVQNKKIESCLFHWFDGTQEELDTICDNGFWISIGPAVLSQKKIQKIAKRVPLENLLLETDSPVRFNNTPSEPAWTKFVTEKIAQIKETDFTQIASRTTKNAFSFFGLPTTDF